MDELAQTVTQKGLQGQPVAETWDVFLSYAAEDAVWVNSLAEKLNSLQLRVFDPYATPSEFWGKSRDEVVIEIFPAKCYAAFLVLSSAYATSKQGARELAIIQETARTDGRCLVLPARLDEASAPEAMRSVAILDARAKSADEVAEVVAAKLLEWKETTKQIPSLSNAKVLRRVFEMLPEDEQQIIRMYYFKDLTASEIAEQLSLSQFTVRKRLHKTLLHMRDLMKFGTGYDRKI